MKVSRWLESTASLKPSYLSPFATHCVRCGKVGNPASMEWDFIEPNTLWCYPDCRTTWLQRARLKVSGFLFSLADRIAP